MDATYLQGRIASIRLQIEAFESAMLAFATNGAIQSYKLDTGQTQQTVTRADLEQLRGTLDGLYNQCAVLEARLNGGAILGRPAW